MTSIEATDLRIVRGKNEVLHTISCQVKKGMLTGLIGPSGSGKTTLMRAIVGVQQIQKWDVNGTWETSWEPAVTA